MLIDEARKDGHLLLCDRVCLLVDGKLRLEASVDDLLDERVEYWQAASEGVSAEALPAYEPQATQGNLNFYRLHSEDEVDQWVDAVRGAGGRVYRITPQRATLEDYFVATVEGARASADPGPAATPGSTGGGNGRT